jgi:hypothetical protein
MRSLHAAKHNGNAARQAMSRVKYAAELGKCISPMPPPAASWDDVGQWKYVEHADVDAAEPGRRFQDM